MCFEKGCIKSLRLHGNVILHKNPREVTLSRRYQFPRSSEAGPEILKEECRKMSKI